MLFYQLESTAERRARCNNDIKHLFHQLTINEELHEWQKDEYVDAHYNAQVMYDELAKILPLPFGYEVFKKHYNNTRS